MYSGNDLVLLGDVPGAGLFPTPILRDLETGRPRSPSLVLTLRMKKLRILSDSGLVFGTVVSHSSSYRSPKDTPPVVLRQWENYNP